tara:strand:+ start:825 stop:959 length:135 start_codon:yes stop_codon:yes gene_type:complete
MKTLELLQDYANSSNNLWLAKQLQALDEEIKDEISAVVITFLNK